jgi:hypothetical protein
MDFIAQEALQILTREQVDDVRYAFACIYLLEHRYEFDVPIFITRPDSCPDDLWEVISADTTPMCFCGNERIMMPASPRTNFEEGCLVTIPSGNSIVIKPVVGGSFSVYVQVEVRQGKVAFSDNVFASSFYTFGKSTKREYDLTTIASVISGSQRQLIYKHSVEGVDIPLFLIECVDILAQSVTICVDKGVEICTVNPYGDHICINVVDFYESI